MLNQLPIKGNLGKDVVLSNSGKAAYFSVAVSKPYTENGQTLFKTIWWDCSVISQRLVEKVKDYKTGTTVKLTGEVDEKEYNGNKKKFLLVLEIDEIVKPENRSNSNSYPQSNAQRDNQGNRSSYQGNQSFERDSDPFGGNGSTIDISDDDLPF